MCEMDRKQRERKKAAKKDVPDKLFDDSCFWRLFGTFFSCMRSDLKCYLQYPKSQKEPFCMHVLLLCTIHRVSMCFIIHSVLIKRYFVLENPETEI